MELQVVHVLHLSIPYESAISIRIYPYSIHPLDFLMVTVGVLCEVWTEILYPSRLHAHISLQMFLQHSVLQLTISFPVALRPNAGCSLLLLEVSRSNISTHHIRYESSGRWISSSQRPLTDNVQHSQQKHIHEPSRIRNRNLSSPAAVDISLRLNGHWDRQLIIYC
jgi:hypothetical protein